MSDSAPRHFRISGLDCAEEVAVLRREVGPVVGGADRLSFDVLRGRMTVSDEAAEVPSRQVLDAVARTGMRAQVWQEGSAEGDADERRQRRTRALLTATSGVAALLACGLHAWWAGSLAAVFQSEIASVPWPAIVAYVCSIVAGAWFVAPKAWHALRRLRPDMNLLMMIAVTGAAAIGQWFEAATVAFLFSLSLLLEAWSVGRAQRAVAALMDLAPPTVRLQTAQGREISVAPDEVTLGSTFIVRPGERIPLDGEIVRGISHVNEAPITGESRPVQKQPDDTVFAGTINGDGAIAVRVTRLADQTVLANIIRLVAEAHSRKAPCEVWVERFARVYTPAVMALALSIVLVPPLLFGQSWSHWFYSGLVLLVIACPCALVISTPVSIVAALATAARHGVLVKGGVFMEAPARLRTIAFDKTGTLTTGQPAVIEIVPLSGHDERELLERAASLESRSEHPLGKAIVEYAHARGVEPMAPSDFQAIRGKGAQGSFGGQPFWLGSHRYLLERGQETAEVRAALEQLASAGRSVVIIGNDEHVCGLIALADVPRSTTTAVMRQLRALGIEHLVMLTGDNAATANALAAHIGVDDVRAELLPGDKVAAIDALLEQYGAVAMVGDGVNDAPALARATIGIAMGTAGSDAAIETADIALMSDDLSRLPWLVGHARRTLSIIRQNVVFALATKAIFVVLTFAGAASLWGAIAADMGASLLVIFNGLRLLDRAR